MWHNSQQTLRLLATAWASVALPLKCCHLPDRVWQVASSCGRLPESGNQREARQPSPEVVKSRNPGPWRGSCVPIQGLIQPCLDPSRFDRLLGNDIKLSLTFGKWVTALNWCGLFCDRLFFDPEISHLMWALRTIFKILLWSQSRLCPALFGLRGLAQP